MNSLDLHSLSSVVLCLGKDSTNRSCRGLSMMGYSLPESVTTSAAYMKMLPDCSCFDLRVSVSVDGSASLS